MRRRGVVRDARRRERYASIAPVKMRAEDWKRRFPKTYKDAWMSHAAPTVFAPFARLELLSWSPLFIPGGGDGPAPPLDGMAWYAELLEYGGALDADDPDGNLVPTLVEKLVAPTVRARGGVGLGPRLGGAVAAARGRGQRPARVSRPERVRRHGARARGGGEATAGNGGDAVRHRGGRRSRRARRRRRPRTCGANSASRCDARARRRRGRESSPRRTSRRWSATPSSCRESCHISGWRSRGRGNAWRASSASPLRAGASGSESARPVAATLGQMARASPEAHSAAAAAADPVGALDPARLVRALAAVGELDEAAAVAKLFGVSVKDGMR